MVDENTVFVNQHRQELHITGRDHENSLVAMSIQSQWPVKEAAKKETSVIDVDTLDVLLNDFLNHPSPHLKTIEPERRLRSGLDPAPRQFSRSWSKIVAQRIVIRPCVEKSEL